ncbi:MAG: WYL domain-containing protein, partial [Oscillospiraceae bacterium]|nr:WYL domain-containing protein [Oscillospiraceae bacterium]
MSAYTELIRNFDKVKDYVREFYIFGFKTRDSYAVKSKRTYDNEKRRIESWLSGYIHSENTGHKKMVSVKVDSSEISGN